MYLQYFLYADDSALLVSHKDKATVETILSNELHNVSQWLIDNRLSLHLDKTEAILFGSKVKLSKTSELRIKVGKEMITTKTNVKYLGCELDGSLSGEDMVTKNISKINQKTKFLARAAAFLDTPTLRILAGSLVQPHFDYAVSSWYTGLSSTIKNKLQKAQNKLIRVVLKLHPQSHLELIHFRQVNWLKVEDRVTYIKMILTYKITKNRVPEYLTNYFTTVRDTHSHFTRGSTINFIPWRFKTQFGKNTFRYSAALLWNRLPMEIKCSPSERVFKQVLRRWLLENCV